MSHQVGVCRSLAFSCRSKALPLLVCGWRHEAITLLHVLANAIHNVLAAVHVWIIRLCPQFAKADVRCFGRHAFFNLLRESRLRASITRIISHAALPIPRLVWCADCVVGPTNERSTHAITFPASGHARAHRTTVLSAIYHARLTSRCARCTAKNTTARAFIVHRIESISHLPLYLIQPFLRIADGGISMMRRIAWHVLVVIPGTCIVAHSLVVLTKFLDFPLHTSGARR